VELRPARRRLQRVDADAAIEHRVAQIRAMEAPFLPAPSLTFAECQCTMLLRQRIELPPRRSNRRLVAFETGDQGACLVAVAARVEIELRDPFGEGAFFSERSEGAIEIRLRGVGQ